ncbi:F-box/kelch-repeat protein [Forsythia ovata]|uniref:F-box/kelch-repeat protein n=1 Tax=Forsythia ovata TaxID=205694 RepID=A0ABD1RL88_9LAMI
MTLDSAPPPTMMDNLSLNVVPQAEFSQHVPILPQEIITEILLRLPVKSLLKFRCVSKLWLSLISTPGFMKTHLKISSNNNIYSHNNLIVGCSSDSLDLFTCPLFDEIDENPSMETVPFDYPLLDPVSKLRIVGSCNGLVCLVLGLNTVIILNPATRKSRELPISSTNVFDTEYGFAYDESNDNYKVVESGWTIGDLDEFKTHVRVYSSRTDSCRIIKGPAGFVFSGCGVFVNGAIHWKLYPRGNPRDWLIAAQDITTDIFEMIEKPKYEAGVVNALLMVSGGRLCVSLSYRTRMDLWVFRENWEEEECWTKLVRVPYFLDLRNHRYIRPKPLLVSENGAVLLSYGSDIVMYEPLQTYEIHPLRERIEFEAATYAESFVSPDFGHEEGSSFSIKGKPHLHGVASHQATPDD